MHTLTDTVQWLVTSTGRYVNVWYEYSARCTLFVLIVEQVSLTLEGNNSGLVDANCPAL